MRAAVDRLLSRWRADRERIRADASGLIKDHGAKATVIATRMAQAERSGQLVSPSLATRHWTRVRREVVRASRRR